MLKHKGYAGRAEFDDEVGLFHGEVFDMRDLITFQGKSVVELAMEFRDSVDDTWISVRSMVKSWRYRLKPVRQRNGKIAAELKLWMENL